MRAGPWRLGRGRVLVEQLRLLLGNVGSSVVPGILLALLLVVTLGNDDNQTALWAWCAVVVASKLVSFREARRQLRAEIPPSRARTLVRRQMVLNAADGLAWGSLAWVTLDTAGLAGSILVVAVLSGIASSSMSSLAPIPLVFAVFLGCELTVLVAKLLQLGNPAYGALAAAGVLQTATLLGQARNGARAARAAIALRFENRGLLARSRREADSARSAQRAADEAKLAQTKFLAFASHDLRQPVHALGLFLGLLERSSLTAAQRGIVDSARAATQASTDMLDTLLDFSRIDAGVVVPQSRPFHLQPLLNRIEGELAPQADAKGLVYRTRETHAAVDSDPALVELVLRNLVSNAIRYADRGGVLVGCRQRGNSVAVEVWDTGIGIDPSRQHEVFLEFHQLGNPERGRNEGLGLGLAIARGMARSLGHPLTLESRPGRGTVFRLLMPAVRTGVVPTLPASLGQGESSLRLPPVHVLVVDDDAAVRAGMRQLLHDWGCGCDAAGGTQEAIVLARIRRPALVISDYRLRDGERGTAAIAAVRADRGGRLPALLITGDTSSECLRDAHASGLPLLRKPMAPAELKLAMLAVLEDASR